MLEPVGASPVSFRGMVEQETERQGGWEVDGAPLQRKG